MAETAAPAEELPYYPGSFGLTTQHDLYKAAYAVLASPQPTPEALAELRRAYLETNVAIREAKSLEHVFQRAVEKYSCAKGGYEINVVGDMTYSNEEDGFYVDAWLYVPAKKGEIEDYDPEENDDEDEEEN